MACHEKPCTSEVWSNPNFINDNREHFVIDGIEMTAQNIWNWHEPREILVEKIADFVMSNEFPTPHVDEAEAVEKISKLVLKDPSEAFDLATGHLKNTSTLCLDVCRSFNIKEFMDTRVNRTPSISEVLSSRPLIVKILKNRMGWCTSSEHIKDHGKNIVGEHPYLFDISWHMIVQGAHSSMTSANVSNFRPLVAKWLIDRWSKDGDSVLDLSAGWGARYLAAMSLKKRYYGIDPMTADNIKKMAELCNKNFKDHAQEAVLVKDGSEKPSSYKKFPNNIDYCFVCPPYFKLEDYKCEGNSTDLFGDYQSWLEHYWRPTVQNASKKLKIGAKFSLIIIEKWEKLDLRQDMSKIIEDCGFKQIDIISYKTTRSHLTDKRKSGKMDKDTEKVVTFEKNA